MLLCECVPPTLYLDRDLYGCDISLRAAAGRSWADLYLRGTLETEAESGASTKEVHTAAGRKQGGLHGVKYVS